MRYGNPSIGDQLEALKQAGCDRVLFAPLYPQYSGATTATAIDALGAKLAKMRWQAAIRTLPPYYDDPLHIEALRADTARQLKALDFEPEVLLLSFHGMPERTLHLGDPYHCQCRKTARLLGEALRGEFPNLRIETTFQSRFGRAKWLEPATDDVLAPKGPRGPSAWPLPRPAFPPIASKRWRSWRSAGASSSRKRAAPILPRWIALTPRLLAWTCWKRWCGAN